MNYVWWLLGLSVLFVLLERAWPRETQPLLRPGIFSDVAYLAFNSEYLGFLLGVMSRPAVAALDRWLTATGWHGAFYLGVMTGLPFAAQCIVLVLAFDFAQWSIHNLLHRVPLLWRIHRVHHSIETMDWIGNWRFHGLEVLVYRALLYPMAALFGFSGEAMFVYGVFSTFMGHLTHANLRVPLGPLKYVLNGPDMHAWHHAHPEAGPENCNFGIALSVWDWMFGMAFLPEGERPRRLGFAGVERFPRNFVTQAAAPLIGNTR